MFGKNVATRQDTWALELSEFKMGDDKLFIEETLSAIIDTGSSQMVVPFKIFQRLHELWKKYEPSLDCKSDDIFC